MLRAGLCAGVGNVSVPNLIRKIRGMSGRGVSCAALRIKHVSRAGKLVRPRSIPAANVIRIPFRISRDLHHEILGLKLSPYEDFETFLSRSRDIVAALVPANIADRVRQTSYSGKGFVVLSGLPRDPDLSKTPSTPGEAMALKKTFVSEGLALGVSALLGCEPFGFRQEGFGSAPLVDNVVPMPQYTQQKGAGGSANNFPFHKESAWHRLTPRFLFLKGVRQDHLAQAQTWVAVLQDILHVLPAKCRQALESPQFWIGAPDLYLQMEKSGIPMGTASEIRTSVIAYNPTTGLPELNVNCNNISSETREGADALRVLEALFYQYAHVLYVKPDNLVIIDNRTMAHTRGGYTPKYDGQDRWFQRVNMHDRLWEDRRVRPQLFMDIPGMDLAKGHRLVSWLKGQGVLSSSGQLSDAFFVSEAYLRQRLMSHGGGSADALFDLPPEYEGHRAAILNCLLTCGPVFPHRIV